MDAGSKDPQGSKRQAPEETGGFLRLVGGRLCEDPRTGIDDDWGDDLSPARAILGIGMFMIGFLALLAGLAWLVW